jgi:hypothetical protein
VTAASDAELEAMAPPKGRLYRIRSHPAYQGAFGVLRRALLPNAFGAVILAGLAFVACRVPFEAASAAGWLCKGGESDSLTVGAASRPVLFPSSELCAPTGLYLNAGSRYRIDLELATPDVWRDASIDVPFPRGFPGRSHELAPLQRALFIVFTPLRRELSGNWFTPFARVGETGIEDHRLSATPTEITALTSGELFLFVNDLIPPLWVCPSGIGWDACYRNNHGSALVTVTRIAEARPSRAAVAKSP